VEVLEELRRDAEGVLAADRNERVDALALEIRAHLVDGAVDLVRVGARRADDRPATRQDAGDLARAERREEAVDHPTPAFACRDNLVATRERPPRDRANHRVQPRAIAPAREDSNLLGHRISPSSGL